MYIRLSSSWNVKVIPFNPVGLCGMFGSYDQQWQKTDGRYSSTLWNVPFSFLSSNSLHGRRLRHIIKHGLDWICLTWTGFVKHGNGLDLFRMYIQPLFTGIAVKSDTTSNETGFYVFQMGRAMWYLQGFCMPPLHERPNWASHEITMITP